MRTNYVLIDFENVNAEAIDRLAQDHFKLLVFVGANQTKLPFETAATMQRLGARAEYVKIAGNGANALDFHIAYYVGHLSAADPSACFHIVSKDTGFDPLIQHLKSRKVLADRVKAVSDIPMVRVACAKSVDERVEVALAKLLKLKAGRPRSLKTLTSTLDAAFMKQVSSDELALVVRALVDRGYVAVEGTKVAYTLPGEC